MSRLILGLNTDNGDSSAILVDEKGPIAAIAEERINRKKHCADFPIMAIKEVLKIAGAKITDVTDIAVARNPKANLIPKTAFLARYPKSGIPMALKRFSVHKQVRSIKEHIADELGMDVLKIKAELHQIEHHLAHIASAFFWSPFDKASGYSQDGAGDFATTMWARCEGNDIKILRRSYWPHSPGVFYSALTQFIGFLNYGEEYKVMGLSAYGENKFSSAMRKIFNFHPQLGLRLNLKYFSHHKMNGSFETIKDGIVTLPQLWSEALIPELGEPRRKGEPLTQRDNDVAASMQIRFEEVFLDIINVLTKQTGIKDMVMAGGSTLNSVANGRMLTEGYADRAYFQPAAGDDGTAAGAAMYVLNSIHRLPRIDPVMHSHWGTQWSDDEIEKALKENGRPYKKLTEEELLNTAAKSVTKGDIMGWFQGREEWGPRALGNRSIICNPALPDMKAILNARIKNREHFRPFAPVIREEELSLCFEGSHPVPFMIAVYKVKPEWREKLPAITHEDNTGRVQTVNREQNKLYYDLIGKVKELCGVPVLLNTSFNENEPVVHTPAQAIATFERTKMDTLGIGAFWVEK
jgi:carbamoyltransferase